MNDKTKPITPLVNQMIDQTKSNTSSQAESIGVQDKPELNVGDGELNVNIKEAHKLDGAQKQQDKVPKKEINGPKGLEPTRYGDWESKGRCYDF